MLPQVHFTFAFGFYGGGVSYEWIWFKREDLQRFHRRRFYHRGVRLYRLSK